MTTPQTLAQEVSSLFTLPDVFMRASAVMDSPTGTEQELVEILSLDPGLATTVLRVANSALYGHYGHVDTLSRAITLIGHKSLRNLVLATSVINSFKDIPEEFVDMETFWDNSVTCGVVANRIARRLRLPEGEALFLAGLLHGVGRLVFYARRPVEYREVLHLAEDQKISIEAAEERVFGFNYAALGIALLQTWGLPRNLQIAVGYQLEPDQAPDHAKEAAVVHLANDIATNLAPCLKPPRPPESYELNAEHLEKQGLVLTQEDVDDIRLDAITTALELIEIIRPGASLIY